MESLAKTDVTESSLMVTGYLSCLITQPQVFDCTSKQHFCTTLRYFKAFPVRLSAMFCGGKSIGTGC